MRTEQTNIYTFDELSDAAKEKAIQDYREKDVGLDGDMIADSIAEACKQELRDAGVTFLASQVKKPYYEIDNSRGTDFFTLPGHFTYQDVEFQISESRHYPTDDEYEIIINGVYKGYDADWLAHEDYDPEIGEIEGCEFSEELFNLRKEEILKIHDEFKRIYDTACDNAVHNFRAELEYQQSDEYIAETIRANEYEYTEEGKPW